VQARFQQRLIAEGRPAERLALVGSAAGKWPMPPVPADTILIHGELDETITLAQVFDWARPLGIPVIVIPGADHFFHRRLGLIKNLIIQMWPRNN
jgi:alpha/beta superfamily hydrolase